MELLSYKKQKIDLETDLVEVSRRFVAPGTFTGPFLNFRRMGSGAPINLLHGALHRAVRPCWSDKSTSMHEEKSRTVFEIVPILL